MKKTKFTLEDTPLFEASNYLQEAISIEVKPIYVMLRAFQHYYVQDYEEALKDFQLCAKLDPESSESQFYMAKTMLDMLDVPYFVKRIKACPSLEDPHA